MNLLNAEDSRIFELEKQIRILEKDNDNLLTKIKDITTSPNTKSTTTNSNNNNNNNGDKYWLKQKIEKVEENVDMKLLKNAGFHLGKDNETCDWKDVLNVSFNIIQKLAKQVDIILFVYIFI